VQVIDLALDTVEAIGNNLPGLRALKSDEELLSELERRLGLLRNASKLVSQQNPRSKFFSVAESPLLQEIF